MDSDHHHEQQQQQLVLLHADDHNMDAGTEPSYDDYYDDTGNASSSYANHELMQQRPHIDERYGGYGAGYVDDEFLSAGVREDYDQDGSYYNDDEYDNDEYDNEDDEGVEQDDNNEEEEEEARDAIPDDIGALMDRATFDFDGGRSSRAQIFDESMMEEGDDEDPGEMRDAMEAMGLDEPGMEFMGMSGGGRGRMTAARRKRKRPKPKGGSGGGGGGPKKLNDVSDEHDAMISEAFKAYANNNFDEAFRLSRLVINANIKAARGEWFFF